ncbi:hypothetical protein RB12843 [Rhodopirellula baltica SH 1]|uniref:Uncharacterized protein n=1 Tax=Rhodopirellula baltica (strain DSM 10527 / NCIMB 13988 / SH1) TaxID=243090 RepID=Q7UI00_RHOBA|nr:hypothetical protein RB12843 [Rhodopirellula baltica SH 1]
MRPTKTAEWANEALTDVESNQTRNNSCPRSKMTANSKI